MASLRRGRRVRVRALLHDPLDYDGWGMNQRGPRVGDEGVLIDILPSRGYDDRYVVECTSPDGSTLWVTDLSGPEIEPAEER